MTTQAATTAVVVARPTPSAPSLASKPTMHGITVTTAPKASALMTEYHKPKVRNYFFVPYA